MVIVIILAMIAAFMAGLSILLLCLWVISERIEMYYDEKRKCLMAHEADKQRMYLHRASRVNKIKKVFQDVMILSAMFGGVFIAVSICCAVVCGLLGL